MQNQQISNDLTRPRKPFRSILITFHEKTDFQKFKETLAELTFLYNNYCSSEIDKNKCIINYKNPYDVAIIIDKYENNNNFGISLFLDELSQTLRTDILYITTRYSKQLESMIEKLQGSIILLNSNGIQAQFPNFKQTAIAYEEIQAKYFRVKFSLKTCSTNVPKIPQIFQKRETHIDLQIIFQKYDHWVRFPPTEFKSTFERFVYKLKIIQKSFSNPIPSKLILNNDDEYDSDDEKIHKDTDESDYAGTPIEIKRKIRKLHKKSDKQEIKHPPTPFINKNNATTQ